MSGVTWPSEQRLFRRATAPVFVGVVMLSMVACGDDDAASASEEDIVETQNFVTRPDLTPPVIEMHETGQASDGFLFLAPKKGDAQQGPLIVDNDGEVVWSFPRGDANVTDFRAQEYQGEPVLTWWEGQSSDGNGQGEFVIMDTSYEEIARLSAGNDRAGDLHEFQLTDDGTALVLVYEEASADLSSIGGDTDGATLDNFVQEIDIESGDVLLEWDASEHVPVSDTYAELDEDEDGPLDWFHVNSVGADDDGGLLMSARNTHAVYYIDRETGELRWVLGGKSSDFTMTDDTTFAWQHDARWTNDGMLSLFDNQAAPSPKEESRAIVLDLDEERGAVELVHERTNPEPIRAFSQGNAQVLEDGGTLVGWGSGSRITEFDANGETLIEAKLAPAETYRAYRMPWTGEPTSQPDAVVEDAEDGQLEVHMSWNGSTTVAQWRVLGGDTEDALTPLTTVDKDGFETSISTDAADHIAVEALDADGNVVGTSEVTTSGD